MKIKKLNEDIQTSDASKINLNYRQNINELDGGVERFVFNSNLSCFIFRRKLNFPQAESGGTLWVKVSINAEVFESGLSWSGDYIDHIDIQPVQTIVDQAKKLPASEKNFNCYPNTGYYMPSPRGAGYYPNYKQRVQELLQNNRSEIEELVNYCYDGLVECLKNLNNWSFSMWEEFQDYHIRATKKAKKRHFKLYAETDDENNLYEEKDIMRIKRLNEEELKSGKELAQKDIDELGRLAGKMQDRFAHIFNINYEHPDKFLTELLKIYSEDQKFVEVIANLCAKDDPWDTI